LKFKGAFMMELCKRNPSIKGVIVDLPQVLEKTKELLAKQGVDNIELSAADFLGDPLPQGDLYILGRILHDWDEEKVRFLVKKVYDSLPKGGALLIAEMLLDNDKRGPLRTQLQSLNMLVQTDGRERSFEEYESILIKAGFNTVTANRTGTYLDAILALKE